MPIGDYPALQERFGGHFIALSNGEVVATGATYRELVMVIERDRLDRTQLTFAHIEPPDSLRAY